MLGESTRETVAGTTMGSGKAGGAADSTDVAAAASSDHRVPACSPSDVQIAFMAAHRAWAKRYAPHLLEEWND